MKPFRIAIATLWAPRKEMRTTRYQAERRRSMNRTPRKAKTATPVVSGTAITDWACTGAAAGSSTRPSGEGISSSLFPAGTAFPGSNRTEACRSELSVGTCTVVAKSQDPVMLRNMVTKNLIGQAFFGMLMDYGEYNQLPCRSVKMISRGFSPAELPHRLTS
ncbi:MAG: hypothetical protein KA004_03530 [Verrucomicrobiales bacterium]|nr:hypothetical protein [Verrucomicrobiales bacterium]